MYSMKLHLATKSNKLLTPHNNNNIDKSQMHFAMGKEPDPNMICRSYGSIQATSSESRNKLMDQLLGAWCDEMCWLHRGNTRRFLELIQLFCTLVSMEAYCSFTSESREKMHTFLQSRELIVKNFNFCFFIISKQSYLPIDFSPRAFDLLQHKLEISESLTNLENSITDKMWHGE